MPDIAYVDGRFLPLDEARVPVNDRAYYFADAVYEVLTTFGGKVFQFDEHLDRLERSLRGVRIPFEVDRNALGRLVEEGIRRAGYAETLIYLQVSRGVSPRERGFPKEAKPNLVLTFREKHSLSPELRERGIEVILLPDERWANCRYKTVMLLPNVLAYQQARDLGRDDAILYEPATGTIHEATAANVFLAKGGRLVTPAENPKMLSGTVRRYVINLARRNGIEVEEREVGIDELLAADEVFLTGTTTEVLGVVRVGDHTIGEGRPGPLTRRLHQLFMESVGAE